VTAITLNLLAEEQLAEQANARDPLKTAVAICASILTLVVMSGSVLYVVAGQKTTEASLLQARLDSSVAAEAAGGTADFRSVKSIADDIIAINHSRPLYAHQLALIKDLVPDSVQLTRITFTLALEVHDAGNADTAGSADADKDKPRRVAVAKVVSHLNLQLEGKAMSNRPELEVDTLIQTLRSNAAFNERVKQIQLRSIAPSAISTSEGAPTVPTAQFIIECQYKELN
jgi:hypothetical protein